MHTYMHTYTHTHIHTHTHTAAKCAVGIIPHKNRDEPISWLLVSDSPQVKALPRVSPAITPTANNNLLYVLASCVRLSPG